jgi:TolA-binding protein
LNDPRWLDDAVGALREQSHGAGPEAQATRARVLASLRVEQRRRSRLLFVVLPIAATFLFSTAWAASTGRLQTLVTQLQTTLGPVPAAVPLATSPARGGAHASARVPARDDLPAPAGDPSTDSQANHAASAAPVGQPAAPVASAPTDPGGASLPGRTPLAAVEPAGQGAGPAVVATLDPRVAEPAPRAAPPVTSVGSRRDDSDALYRVAHEAHFVEQNPQKALRAWDDYLRAAPGGRFAAEASYNRALTLVRLGRHAEARAALRPFASGRPGSYRQHEAAQLIEALGG